MSEKRFTGKLLTNSNGEEFGFTIYDEDKRMSIDEVVGVLNEQQATITHLEEECGARENDIKLLRAKLQDYNEIKENWESMVAKATEVSLRNVELAEENAQLHKKIDWLCEVFEYGSDESMQKVKEYEQNR